MNPFPMVRVLLSGNWKVNLTLGVFVMLATALGIAVVSQERALQSASAQAVDKFDLIIGAPGSTTDLTLKALFLRPGTVELLNKDTVRAALTDKRAAFAAPLGFGDSVHGAPVVGTTNELIMHLASGKLAEGSPLATWEDAVVGALSPLKLGDTFKTTHGHEEEEHAEEGEAEHEHPSDFIVKGRLPFLGSPWDKAVIIPIEKIWVEHGLTSGHAPDKGEVLGPPFDADFVPEVPAIVVKPGSITAAYGLRNVYRAERSTAFFPAEVLVGLYEVLGDIRKVMSAMAAGAGALVIATVIVSVVILIGLQERKFAILRALGAPKAYIFSAVWLYVSSIVASGAIAGVLAGWLGSFAAGLYVADETGMAVSPSIGWTELSLAAVVILTGCLFATVPAVRIIGRRLDLSLKAS
jgi:putative ABC transport system permease protein